MHRHAAEAVGTRVKTRLDDESESGAPNAIRAAALSTPHNATAGSPSNHHVS